MTTTTERFGTLPTLPTIELPACLEFLKLKNFPLKVYPPVYEAPRPIKDTLYIYGPGYRNSWGSFDVDCLQIQMYMKFCGIDVQVVNSNEPDASPSGKLPFLATVTGAVYHGEQIHQWIQDMASFSKDRQADDQGKAFITLAKTKLHAAMLFSMWLEPLNYTYTSKAYYDHIPAPVNSWLAYKKQNDVVQTLLVDRDILVREEIYQEAEQALEALSVKLGDATYFFNASEPTWMDVVVFSYLHVILGAPQITDASIAEVEKRQAHALRGLVRKHENLVRYAKNIYEQYLK
ncbi:hypothetical protein DFQ28_006862 [Apophysomyces sp. BC1034]|nr:hypothetical protein DFQ30_006784 [Apophysomyces sp. BC1015]KAG0176723.1 hypothetical protein DFQ29_005705 [Apophysomyces sp. BC1021]KAG0187098.1 hypothetical protein DFQ28_006862 [Apophysomyces sp. BC1034]